MIHFLQRRHWDLLKDSEYLVCRLTWKIMGAFYDVHHKPPVCVALNSKVLVECK